MSVCLRNCKNKKECDSRFSGQPDLRVACRKHLDRRGKPKLNYDQFMRDIVGAEKAYQLYGYVVPNSKVSARLKKQEQERERLLQLQKAKTLANILNTQKANNQKNSLLALETIKLQMNSQQKQGQKNLMLFVAIALVAFFIIQKVA